MEKTAAAIAAGDLTQRVPEHPPQTELAGSATRSTPCLPRSRRASGRGHGRSRRPGGHSGNGSHPDGHAGGRSAAARPAGPAAPSGASPGGRARTGHRRRP
ncbi:hypothetical protein ACQPZP_31370 [Spirillospora sp. CA-142024]|uniref:hypothetical protein n=1 Tax=Spirillospora sp. CA-142024 TaxID=3240036 RepID=UPI003D91DB9A